MDDRANIAYGAHPERLYVVKDGIVVFEVFYQHYFPDHKHLILGGPGSF